jgi:hypothetical protein
LAGRSQGGEAIVSLPDGNNCYGELIGLDDLQPIASCLAAGGWSAHLRASGYDGTQRLFVEGECLELQTEPLGAGEHLFNGGVGGDPATAVALLGQVAQLLTTAGFTYRLELYGEDGQEIAYFSHRWDNAVSRESPIN